MRNQQSSYEIVEDCSNKGGHRHQPLHRFILREVLAWKRVTFMLCVMTYVVSYKKFGIELVLCDFKLYLTKFDLTKGLLFDTFFTVYKLCRCDH